MRLKKSDIKMLKITKRTEYGLIALTHIKHSSKDNLISSNKIASHYNIPKELMAKTLQVMVKKGYLKAVKGSSGGYKSNVKLKDVSLKDFIESLEGPLALTDCYISDKCEQITACNIKEPINRINDNLLDFLDNISLMEITK
tara:strand:- start:276 stop:701 length:426 start_codon:yes stop_codon:yes gene_type:complete